MQSNSITCVNGRFVAADEAVLPIADRGFRFGDGVFETIRLVSGVPYQWELHIGRAQV
jgi:branched-chain amino acid aminotransferase